VGARDQYLEAIGIETWERRRRAEPPSSGPQAPPAIAAAGKAAPLALQPVPAGGAGAWDTLQGEVQRCTRCVLAGTRTQTVFGVGNRRAELLVVGEAPGADEDRQGEPFVGRAGQLLNAMLRAMGRPRETVYIANILKCRPPGNRDPAPEEVACCMPYLLRQIELLAPRVMLAVGRIAAQNLLGTDTPIGKLRGRVHEFGAARIPLIVTYHPAYLLRSPGEKRKAWSDLKFLRTELRRRGAGPGPA
jgi:uracil-DNA glycosylase family 4